MNECEHDFRCVYTRKCFIMEKCSKCEEYKITKPNLKKDFYNVQNNNNKRIQKTKRDN